MIKKLLILIMIFTLTSCQKNDNNLYVFNWGEYIEPEVVQEFKKETGINVVYDTFVQNEDMFMKMKEGGGKYDVIFPSDYMVERMIDEDMILELDKSKLKNYKYIDDNFKDLSYDKQSKHSIVYMWGTVGIVYNKKFVKDINSWKDLWNKKYKDQIIMMDSMRDSIGVSLIKNGYSLNSRNIDQLNKAREDLINQKDLVLAYMVDETKSLMVNEEAWISLMYSGDALTARYENENLKYVIPKEGTNIWYDCMVINKESGNVENAYKFIDFLLKPENMAKNGIYTGASIPEKKAIEIIKPKKWEREIQYPNLKKTDKLEIYKNPSDFAEVYDEIWADVKAH
ncbi:MAG: spermidine/putrescine ABC transporter substrate-binding protein [Tissierellia bacterium]|nr:spermidine/putrescine ABC transporter substrate-binding protein [Tissierellia bacterium]